MFANDNTPQQRRAIFFYGVVAYVAALATAYILVGIQMEERDLLKTLGSDYETYRARTPILIPNPRKFWNGVSQAAADHVSTTAS